MKEVNWNLIIDIVIALYGIYIVFAALNMKKSGWISSLVATQEELYHCKKKKEFIKELIKPMCYSGVASILCGGCSIVNELLLHNIPLRILFVGIFLLFTGLFLVRLRKMREKYIFQ